MSLNATVHDPLLTVRQLDVTFTHHGHATHALKEVSLDIRRGEVLAVIGESGSGKSTLARTIMGMVPRASGEIFLDREKLAASAAKRSVGQRRRIGMVFQDSSAAFDPRYTVERILDEPLRLIDTKQAAARRLELLDAVSLPSSVLAKRPRELSGGQRQRVGIARALAGNPELLICDEAVSALDLSVQAQILNLLSDLQADRQLTLLFITHDLSVVSYLADRIAVMHRGSLVECGEAAQILDHPEKPYTRGLFAASL